MILILAVTFGMWLFLSAYIGPALSFFAIVAVFGFHFFAPNAGLWVLVLWLSISFALVTYMRYRQGINDYLESMNHLRYNAGGSGMSLDFELILWTFFLPGRMLLKIVWLERAPKARYVKSVPLSLGDCVRYHE